MPPPPRFSTTRARCYRRSFGRCPAFRSLHLTNASSASQRMRLGWSRGTRKNWPWSQTVSRAYECREAPDREIGKPGENRGKVIAHRDLQPTAAFHYRENRCNLRSRLWAADVQPILSTNG